MSKKYLKPQMINISQFKTDALKLLAKSAKEGKEYIVTKRGVPLARVTPLPVKAGPRRGSLKDVVKIKGDIVEFDSSSEWESAS